MLLEGIPFDEYGPEKVLVIHDEKTKMHGVLCIDNTRLGPGKGGVRLVPDISIQEVYRLARAMTWKNAMAGLPFGGAKAGIMAPKNANKKEIFHAFARALAPVIPKYYIAGPDINVTENEMGYIAEILGPNASTGKPASMGGLPHELGSTGYGVYESSLIAMEYAKVPVKGATVAIEGFGNVGTFAARFLSKDGAKIVAISDSTGCAVLNSGFDAEKMIEVKTKTGSVLNYPGCQRLAANELFALPVDLLIPGARPDVITDANKGMIKAKVIVQAANIPIPAHVERELEAKGIVNVPDFVANAGGIISSYVEHIHGNQETMFKMVKERISENTKLMLDRAHDKKISSRDAAMEIARERLEAKKAF